MYLVRKSKKSHVKVSLTIENVDCVKFSCRIILLYLIRSKPGLEIHSEKYMFNVEKHSESADLW